MYTSLEHFPTFDDKSKALEGGTSLGFSSVQDNFPLSLGSCSQKIPSVTSEIEITNKRNFAMTLMWILWTKNVYLWNPHLTKGLFKCFFGGFRFHSWTPHLGMLKSYLQDVFQNHIIYDHIYMYIYIYICPLATGIKDECPKYFLVQCQLELLYYTTIHIYIYIYTYLFLSPGNRLPSLKALPPDTSNAC